MHAHVKFNTICLDGRSVIWFGIVLEGALRSVIFLSQPVV